MKTLLRLTVILLACLLITGALYTLGQTDWATQQPPGRFERLRGAEGIRENAGGENTPSNRNQTEDAQPLTRRSRPENGRFEGERGAQFLSLRGWLGFARTLIPIAIIISLVTLLTKGVKSRQRRRDATVTPANTPA